MLTHGNFTAANRHEHSGTLSPCTRKLPGVLPPVHNGRIALPCPALGRRLAMPNRNRLGPPSMDHAGPQTSAKFRSAKALEIDTGLGIHHPTLEHHHPFSLRHRQTRGCLRSTAQAIHVAGLPIFKDSVLLLHG